MITVTIIHGKKATKIKIDPLVNKSQEKPIKIFNKACPDIILAKRPNT